MRVALHEIRKRQVRADGQMEKSVSHSHHELKIIESGAPQMEINFGDETMIPVAIIGKQLMAKQDHIKHSIETRGKENKKQMGGES